jgi:hypothetical protein
MYFCPSTSTANRNPMRRTVSGGDILTLDYPGSLETRRKTSSLHFHTSMFGMGPVAKTSFFLAHIIKEKTGVQRRFPRPWPILIVCTGGYGSHFGGNARSLKTTRKSSKSLLPRLANFWRSGGR